ncbi:MAG: hydrolase [Candidatus Epulonipiscioides saccharophilum]|nr:hydrolase [Epulopiscium sp. SCG-B10WGA-EpuloB]OON95563.1 MAG: hydrolase [Epulopiscium sp. AS2M-Bin001]
MIETVSCGGVVIYKGKLLILYKDYKNKYVGWVLPKGTVEIGETHQVTAVREVREESGVNANIVKYVGTSQYSFQGNDDVINKSVHWYLMKTTSFYTKPQREEYFLDAGFYKYHEAYHLLKFSDERYVLKKAYNAYLELRKNNQWFSKDEGNFYYKQR